MLIYDNAPQFTSIDYSWYNINCCTSVPNMNAYVERLNDTVWSEVLDCFLLFSEKQILGGLHHHYYRSSA
jgi:transposase InsO family protein